MAKKGQVTAFMIIGIVLIIVVALVFLARNQIGIGVPKQQFLDLQLKSIQDEVNRCVDERVPEGLKLLGLQGGTLQPGNYRLYKGNQVSYLCSNIPNDNRCLNMLQPLGNFGDSLKKFSEFELNNCLDPNKFKNIFGAYDINIGKLNVDIGLENEKTLINVDYPVTLSKGDAKVTLPKITREIDAPIGSLYEAVYQIINGYASTGDFLHEAYMFQNRGEIEIKRDTVYPDIIFVLNKKNSDYAFQFAIEGEEERVK